MASEESIKRVRDFVNVLQGSGAPHQQGIAKDITAVLDSLVNIETLRAASDLAIANALAAIDARDAARAEVTKLTEMLDRATNPNTTAVVPELDMSKGTLRIGPVMEVSKIREMLDRETNPNTTSVVLKGASEDAPHPGEFRISVDGGSMFEIKDNIFEATDGGTVAAVGASQDEAPASTEPEKKD